MREGEKQKENTLQWDVGRNAFNQEADFENIDCPYDSDGEGNPESAWMPSSSSSLIQHRERSLRRYYAKD